MFILCASYKSLEKCTLKTWDSSMVRSSCTGLEQIESLVKHFHLFTFGLDFVKAILVSQNGFTLYAGVR